MAKVKYDMIDSDLASAILSEAKSIYGLKTYISLFSSAGVGCYGFKEEGFYCIATVELLEKFYAIARNLGTRSLNIDNNSVFFFGKIKSKSVCETL